MTPLVSVKSDGFVFPADYQVRAIPGSATIVSVGC